MLPQLPEDVSLLLSTLNNHGYEAYIVGGCVRDSLMGRTPHDWDLTTSATPEEVKTCFPHTVDTGLAHGTVTVVLHQNNYEITTYRVEGDYEDCRHPSYVSFTRNLAEDLLRRDFTINAIAYHPAEGLIDLFGGQKDIENKVIRGVGNPDQRFQEDALRMLRAIRFASQLDFTIEPVTRNALQKNAALIQKISGERIREELGKALQNPYPSRLCLLWESSLLPYLFGEDAAEQLHHAQQSILDTLARLPPGTALAFAAFLDPLPDMVAKAFLKKLKFDNQTLRTIRTLLSERQTELSPDPTSVRRLLSRLGIKRGIALFTLKQAQGNPNAPACLAEAERIFSRGDCLTIGDLAISGADLLAPGDPQGKALGDTLQALLDQVLAHPEINQRPLLLSLATSALSGQKSF